MKTQRIGAVIAAIGAVYLVTVAWMASWWQVPALAAGQAFGGAAFFITWGVSGVLGPIIVVLGAAVYAKIGTLRWLLLAAGSTLVLLWLVLWSASSHNPAVYGIGGGLIVVFFLISCLDWARARRGLNGLAAAAADLRLAANLGFFLAAWGLCGLLGAPIFLLRPELRAASAGSSMAGKVLVCLVLGWGLTAIAQRMERRSTAGDSALPAA